MEENTEPEKKRHIDMHLDGAPVFTQEALNLEKMYYVTQNALSVFRDSVCEKYTVPLHKAVFCNDLSGFTLKIGGIDIISVEILSENDEYILTIYPDMDAPSKETLSHLMDERGTYLIRQRTPEEFYEELQKLLQITVKSQPLRLGIFIAKVNPMHS